jgi:UDP-glucose 4-epimerase
MNIMVTGGAGYIGSHMVHHLLDEGHNVTILDSLTTGFRELVHPRARLVICDIRDTEQVRSTLVLNGIEAVMHFAGLVKVEESIANPLTYYSNNTYGTLCLLEAIKQTSAVKYFIFSSTAAVYGNTSESFVAENHPTEPINPYGRCKLMAEQILRDFSDSYSGLRFMILRYFNVAGAHPTVAIGPRHQNATHLIKVAAETASGKREGLSIFGNDYPTVDGTCVRDYIHVMDLVAAHGLALKYLAAGNKSEIVNLGYGCGHSVTDVVQTMSAVANKPLPVQLAPRRLGDCASVVADCRKAQELLDWSPRWNDLRKICETAYQWEVKLRDLPHNL